MQRFVKHPVIFEYIGPSAWYYITRLGDFSNSTPNFDLPSSLPELYRANFRVSSFSFTLNNTITIKLLSKEKSTPRYD